MFSNDTTSIERLQENILSIAKLKAEHKVREISISMLPLQHLGHIASFADSFGEGWLDPVNMQMHMQFHLVAVFMSAKIDRLFLAIPGSYDLLPLSPANVASPGLGEKYPDIPWAGESRFTVNETLDLPDEAASTTKFELLVDVAGKKERIGVINVIGEQNRNAVQETTLKIDEPEVEAIPSAEEAVVLPKSGFRYYALQFITRVKNMNRLFLLTVVLPTLLATIYYGFIASDVYISESRFVIRSPKTQSTSGLGAFLQGAGFSRSQDDAYNVHDYILSRDALKQLDAKFGLAKGFSNSKVDFASRFNTLGLDDSFEALFLYFQNHIVDLYLDSSSAISTLTVRAYSAESAYEINEKLLEMGESLVNELNDRGRQDMIRYATGEVETAEQRAKNAALAISNYRNTKGIYDPENQSGLQLELVSKMQDDLIASKIQLAQIRSQASSNPQIPALQQRIETLQAAINTETSKVVGGKHSLSNKAPDYEALKLELEFAGKQLDVALTTLEEARKDAMRQQLYLERVVQPNKPDTALEPRRIRNILATVLLGLIIWGILTLLIAGIREHQD